jgi:hypothetical protein
VRATLDAASDAEVEQIAHLIVQVRDAIARELVARGEKVSY